MTIPHVPVLAGEAIELLDPQPGQTVVDCTFGAGGHARLLGERIGATGTLIAIDRDPIAAERFAELAQELACTTRFIRASFVEGLERLQEEGVKADVILMDLGMSSMQIDTWQRGFSYSYDAPLDMRMDPGLERSAHELVNESEPRHLERSSATSARSATPGRSPARSCAPVRRPRSTRRSRSSTSSRAPCPRPPASPAAIPPSASSRRCGSPSTTSSASSTRRSRSRGTCCAIGGKLGAISFHSLEDRRVKRFLVAPRAGLHLPAGPADLRLRPRARGRARQPSRDRAQPGRGRRQPARALGAPARRLEATRGPGMSRSAAARTQHHDERALRRPRPHGAAHARRCPVPPTPATHSAARPPRRPGRADPRARLRTAAHAPPRRARRRGHRCGSPPAAPRSRCASPTRRSTSRAAARWTASCAAARGS